MKAVVSEPMESRREVREDVLIPARLSAGGPLANVAIQNVSPRGMMIAGRAVPEIGSEVEILRAHWAATGRVVWAMEGQCGIRTHKVIDTAALARGVAAMTGFHKAALAPETSTAQSPTFRLRSATGDNRFLPRNVDRLRQVHEEILSAILALQALTSGDAPASARLAEARWKLGSASARRSKFVEDAIHDLAGRTSIANLVEIDTLRHMNVVSRSASTKHIARWTVDRVIGDWTGYCRASRAMTAAMRERVALEASLLYPLMEAH